MTVAELINVLTEIAQEGHEGAEVRFEYLPRHSADAERLEVTGAHVNLTGEQILLEGS